MKLVSSLSVYETLLSCIFEGIRDEIKSTQSFNVPCDCQNVNINLPELQFKIFCRERTEIMMVHARNASLVISIR